MNLYLTFLEKYVMLTIKEDQKCLTEKETKVNLGDANRVHILTNE